MDNRSTNGKNPDSSGSNTILSSDAPKTLWQYGVHTPEGLTVEEKALRNGLLRLYDSNLDFQFRATAADLVEIFQGAPDDHLGFESDARLQATIAWDPVRDRPIAIAMFVEDNDIEALRCVQKLCSSFGPQLFVVAKEFAYQAEYLERAAMIGDGDVAVEDWATCLPSAFCPNCGSFLVLKYYGRSWRNRKKVFFGCSAFLDRYADGVYCTGFTCDIDDIDKYYANDQRKEMQLRIKAFGARRKSSS